MPADAAQAILQEAKRRVAAPSGPQQPVRREVTTSVDAYVVDAARAGAEQDAVFIPASARTLLELLVPTADEFRIAVLNAVVTAAVTYLVAQHAGPTARTQPPAEDLRRAVPALVERDPTPAPPLPSLVTPEDAASEGEE